MAEATGATPVGRARGSRSGPLAALTDLRFAGAVLFAGLAAVTAVDFQQVPVILRTIGHGIGSAFSDVAGGMEHVFFPHASPSAPPLPTSIQVNGSRAGAGAPAGANTPPGASLRLPAPVQNLSADQTATGTTSSNPTGTAGVDSGNRTVPSYSAASSSPAPAGTSSGATTAPPKPASTSTATSSSSSTSSASSSPPKPTSTSSTGSYSPNTSGSSTGSSSPSGSTSSPPKPAQQPAPSAPPKPAP